MAFAQQLLVHPPAFLACLLSNYFPFQLFEPKYSTRESESEKLPKTKCGCPGIPFTSLAPIVRSLDDSLKPIETNGIITGPIASKSDSSENLTKTGTLVGAIIGSSTSQKSYDEGLFGNVCNDRVDSCPEDEEHLLLWSNTATENKEEKEVESKEEAEETTSVHFFLEQLVGEEGWRKCVEVRNLLIFGLLKKIASDRCCWSNYCPGAQTLGRVEDQTFGTN